MANRFFIDQPLIENQNAIELGGDQAHHAIHVMRFRVGNSIELMDGQGNLHIASISEVAKRTLQLSIESSSFEPPQENQIAIATALPKGDRQKFLIEKLVELGVNWLLPLKTERSVASAGARAVERIEKQIIEASKQCGRRYLMQVQPESSIQSLIQSFDSATHRLLADPYSQQSLCSAEQIPEHPDKSSGKPQTVIAIGPEGGFSQSETDQFARAAWQPVRLSNHILRIETAAISAAVQLRLRGS
jgi:16S rRNA (uracil1498-N3)-methyltransferase